MRRLAVVPALLLAGIVLGGCSTGAPPGVLPRDNLPPPPSVSGKATGRSTAVRQSNADSQRGAISVPSRAEAPRPSSSPAIEPVMTPSGAGAGFRF